MVVKDILKNISLWIKRNLIATVLVGIIIPVGLFVYEYNDSKNKDYLLELDSAR
ncbi:hypothetical protein HT659_08455, partial [Ursidibacter maritimus]|nr:hypothetical protein [Ursidibacter maritimus]